MEEDSGTRGGIVARGSRVHTRSMVDRHMGVVGRIQSSVDLDVKEVCRDTAVDNRAWGKAAYTVGNPV